MNAEQKELFAKLIEKARDLEFDRYAAEQRIMDNSCCTSRSYYIEGEAANDKEQVENNTLFDQAKEILDSL
jgi:hypothetical protein